MSSAIEQELRTQLAQREIQLNDLMDQMFVDGDDQSLVEWKAEACSARADELVASEKAKKWEEAADKERTYLADANKQISTMRTEEAAKRAELCRGHEEQYHERLKEMDLKWRKLEQESQSVAALQALKKTIEEQQEEVKELQSNLNEEESIASDLRGKLDDLEKGDHDEYSTINEIMAIAQGRASSPPLLGEDRWRYNGLTPATTEEALKELRYHVTGSYF